MKSPRWFATSAMLLAACSSNSGLTFVSVQDAGTADATTDAGVDVRVDVRPANDLPSTDVRDVATTEAAVPADGGARTPVCERCEGADDCGPDGVCVQVASGSRACLPRCNPDVPLCPGRLRCVLDVALANVAVCAPIGGTCCIDPDMDEYGQGIGCRGPDCAEGDPSRMGPPEACVSADAGTDTGVDVGVDAGTDAGTDVGTDAGTDVGTDRGTSGTCDPTYVRWDIPAGTVGGPECIRRGGGYCEGTGHCSGGTCYTTPPGGCGGDPHCGTLRCNDGSYTRERYCSVRATCDGTSGIVAIGYNW